MHHFPQNGGPFATFQKLASPSGDGSFSLQACDGAFLSTDLVTVRENPACFAQLASGALEVLGTGKFLAVDLESKTVRLVASAGEATPLRILPARIPYPQACAQAGEKWAAGKAPAAPLPPPTPHTLSPEDLATFARDGYLVIKASASPLAVEASLRTINSLLGGIVQAAAAAGGSEAQPAAPAPPMPSIKHSSHPTLLALFTSSRAAAAAQQLLASPVPLIPGACQVAPRFPAPLSEGATNEVLKALSAASATGAATAAAAAAAAAAAPPPLAALSVAGAQSQGPRTRWHIDGHDKAEGPPFSLLVGAFLSDTPGEGAGQFTVFPGSHRALASVLAEQGPGALYGGGALLAQGRAPTLPEECQPCELRVRAGDAVIAHPLLAHRVGQNYSPHIRYACFYRLRARDREGGTREAARGGALFAELPGVQLQGGGGATASA